MTSRFRRYEIVLPLRFNDGHPVPDELIANTLIELRQKFGAVSCETQTIQGQWQLQDRLFRDDLMRMFGDVADTPENRAFFVEFKTRICAAFQQIDIWMTTYPIEVI